MKNWTRRIRAAVGVGLIWGAAWFGAGMVLLLIVGPNPADVPFPLGFGMFGFLAGTTFSTLLGFAERGRRLEELSLARCAAWGGAAGVLLSVMFAGITAMFGETIALEHLGLLAPIFGLAGATSAGGLLALARRGRDPELIDGGADATDRRLGDGLM